MFWYACGHCYLLEPKLEAWARSGKPAYVEFVRQPATWNEMLKTHARVFYTAELLGKLPQLHADIFREINVKGNRLDTPESIEAFFVSRGVAEGGFPEGVFVVRRGIEGTPRRRSQSPLPHHRHADGDRERQVHDRRRAWPARRTTCSRSSTRSPRRTGRKADRARNAQSKAPPRAGLSFSAPAARANFQPGGVPVC